MCKVKEDQHRKTIWTGCLPLIEGHERLLHFLLKTDTLIDQAVHILIAGKDFQETVAQGVHLLTGRTKQSMLPLEIGIARLCKNGIEFDFIIGTVWWGMEGTGPSHFFAPGG